MRPTLSLTLPLLALPLLASASHSNQNTRHRHKRAADNYAIAERAQLDQLAEEQTEYNNGTISKRGDSYQGTGTYFFVGLGACGQYSKDSDYMVALNWQLYGGGYPGPQCFKYITIEANGVTVGGVEILDECPSCPNTGDLDLSPGLFQRFANTAAGTIQMTWWFNDGSGGQQQTTTSQTPTSTWVAPTSTWTPPTSTQQAYTPPVTTSTTTWSPSPSPSTWNQPSSTSLYIAPSSSTTSITSSSAISSSSTTTSSAAISTITSSTWSGSNSNSRNATVNPFAVISSYAASGSQLAASAAVSGTAGVTTTEGGGDEGTGTSVLTEGNLVALNGLVANYGNLIVQGAQVGH